MYSTFHTDDVRTDDARGRDVVVSRAELAALTRLAARVSPTAPVDPLTPADAARIARQDAADRAAIRDAAKREDAADAPGARVNAARARLDATHDTAWREGLEGGGR